MNGARVVVEQLSPLDERYISNVVLHDAMTATATLFLEGAPLLTVGGDLDERAIRARIDAATWAAPALRQRMMRTPLGIGAPAWVPVDGLDLAYHVTFHPSVVADDRDAARLLSGRAQPRLDLRHPMWRILFVRLDSGLVALVFTWHHVLGDAHYGMEVMRRVFDTEPRAVIRPVGDDDRERLGRAPGSGRDLLKALGRQRERSPRPARPAALPKRIRRWLSRVGRPLKDAFIVRSSAYRRLPVLTSSLVRMPLAAAEDTARAAGGSLTDLTVAATFDGIFRQRPDVATASLLVPISRRRGGAEGGGGRNAMSATLVTLPRARTLSDLIPGIRTQIAAGVRGTGIPDGARFGYATMVPSGETDRWFGPARIVAIAGWPAGDPRDEVAVLASSFRDELTVAITVSAAFDVDAFSDSVAAAFREGVRA